MEKIVGQESNPNCASKEPINASLDGELIPASNILQVHMQRWLEDNRPAIEQFAVALHTIFAEVGKVVLQVREVVQRARPQIVQFLETVRLMPAAYRGAIMQLGERGWYLDGKMPLSAPLEYAEQFLSNRIEEAEVALEFHFTGRLDGIELELTTAFPSRAKILAAAFSAHREGKYELSVPVFLTQVDGICAELTGFSPFIREKKRNGGPSTAAYVDSLDNVFLEALLVPFSENLPMNANKNERESGFQSLNRHTVLHGECVDYGTERNSLKAISLLNYSAQYLALSQEDKKNKEGSALDGGDANCSP